LRTVWSIKAAIACQPRTFSEGSVRTGCIRV
jgi:hypothetical protein